MQSIIMPLGEQVKNCQFTVNLSRFITVY